MKLSEIFTESIKYPFCDYKKFLIVGIIALLASVSNIITDFALTDSLIILSGIIIGFIFAVILSGYSISVLKESLDYSEEIPSLNLIQNIKDGLKVILISIVYLIIPIVIVLVIGGFTSVIGASLDNIIAALGVSLIIAAILFIIFGIFQIIAVIRFADSGSMDAAFKLREIYDDIRRIGILKLIAFLIIAIIIIILSSVIGSLIALIPYIGLIISQILVGGFISLFYYHALGLLYLE